MRRLYFKKDGKWSNCYFANYMAAFTQFMHCFMPSDSVFGDYCEDYTDLDNYREFQISRSEILYIIERARKEYSGDSEEYIFGDFVLSELEEFIDDLLATEQESIQFAWS